ncbi:hypothetical protein Tco_0663058 [Tanacetum coccineum]
MMQCLSWTGLPEFADNTVTDYTRPTPSVDVSKDVSASFLEQRESVGNVLSKPMISFVKETGCPSVSKVNNTEKSRKPTVKYAGMYRMSYPHPKRNFVPKAVLMKTGMRPVNAAKPKAAYNAVKRNRFNVIKASAC